MDVVHTGTEEEEKRQPILYRLDVEYAYFGEVKEHKVTAEGHDYDLDQSYVCVIRVTHIVSEGPLE